MRRRKRVGKEVKGPAEGFRHTMQQWLQQVLSPLTCRALAREVPVQTYRAFISHEASMPVLCLLTCPSCCGWLCRCIQQEGWIAVVLEVDQWQSLLSEVAEAQGEAEHGEEGEETEVDSGRLAEVLAQRITDAIRRIEAESGQ